MAPEIATKIPSPTSIFVDDQISYPLLETAWRRDLQWRDTQMRPRHEAEHAHRKRAHIANDVRHVVVARDGLRCSYVGSDGSRCKARGFLQLHHEHAWAKGGADASDNLRLLCAQHNRLLAEQEYGRQAIERAWAPARARTMAPG